MVFDMVRGWIGLDAVAHPGSWRIGLELFRVLRPYGRAASFRWSLLGCLDDSKPIPDTFQ